MGFFDFLSKPSGGGRQPHFNLLSRLKQLFVGGRTFDGDLLEAVEELLLSADLSMEAVEEIVEGLQGTSSSVCTLPEATNLIKNVLVRRLQAVPPSPPLLANVKPRVYLIVGVNGVGKTTTVGKLAAHFSREGKKVLIGAGDTFRAAALEQLQVWGARAHVPVVYHRESKAPSATAFAAVQQGIEQGADVVLIDTAGRLHVKLHLMEELAKINRVVGKQLPGAPHEVLLVLDGSTGQNAVAQARHFASFVPITGLIVTKLDGNARGGALISIVEQMHLPIYYVGVGEKLEDLYPFDAKQFVEGLLGGSSAGSAS